MSGTIPIKDQKLLAFRCGNRCANCKSILIEDATEVDPASILGYMAHIKGEKPTSARYDAKMPEKERNQYPNLIVLCGNCHKKIDDQPNTYTVEKLCVMKKKHESWIKESTKTEVPNITYAELDVVVKYISSDKVEIDDSLAWILQKDKVNKNNLSPSSESQIKMGLTQANQVSKYIEQSLDPDFGDKLKMGFVTEYEKLKKEGLEGDDLFDTLMESSKWNYTEFKTRAAVLAVITYLFETCEIFEK